MPFVLGIRSILTDGGDGDRDFTELELVEDGRLTSGVEILANGGCCGGSASR
jgi:hypothetical protein